MYQKLNLKNITQLILYNTYLIVLNIFEFSKSNRIKMFRFEIHYQKIENFDPHLNYYLNFGIKHYY